MKIRPILALAATASIAFAACSGAATPAPATPAPPTSPPASLAPGETAAPSTPAPAPATVRLQLQWVPQAQFAGYFAAEKQGYFAAEGLTVNIVPGGPDVIPQVAGSAPDGPEFTISWVPKVLEAREQGSDLVNIAQIFQRSGTLSVSWADSGITGPADFAGKKIGVWDFGNEFEVTAGALTAGLVAGTDYTKVIQPFDMSLLLNRQIDVAEAMIYNEYAQVLEATNPATGNLYQPSDLSVINWNDYRVGMLQDALFARQAWLDAPGNRDIAVRFVRASLNGWIYCRDNPADCIQYTVDAGSTLGSGPPGLDDERDQRAGLAVAPRCGRGRSDQLGRYGQGLARHRDHQGPARLGRLRDRHLEGSHRGHRRFDGPEGRRLRQGHRRGDPGRQLAPGGN